MTLSELVAVEVMGYPKPPDMTYQQASKEDGGKASCFQIVRDGWVAYVDWGNVTKTQLYSETVEWKPDAEYDTNITDAWRVVEAVKLVYRQGYCSVTVQRTAAGNPEYSYECFICERVYDKETGWATEKHCVIANATTAPLAICLAALRARGVSEDRIEQARRKA
ncbi:MAG: BC1872 family protein [Phycisphaerales bacterium]|jgi:hypothetical protein